MTWTFNDWFVVVHVNAVLITSSVFVFMHPDQFSTYAMLAGSVIAFFQFMVIRDDKIPDAKCKNPPPEIR